VAEQGEFRLNAPPAPGWILPRHASNEVADLGVEPRPPPRVRYGPPAPVELEALAMPGEDRRGSDDEEMEAPPRPPAGQPHPENPIPTGQPGSGNRSLKDQQLMAERKVLEGDRRRLAEEGAEDGPESNYENHRGTPASRMTSEPRLYRISGGGGEGSRREGRSRRDRAALRWRTGSEGRISVLKRRHGLRRCRYRGIAGMERWVGLGVIANDLLALGRVGPGPGKVNRRVI
jgi:hypothetical protein